MRPCGGLERDVWGSSANMTGCHRNNMPRSKSSLCKNGPRRVCQVLEAPAPPPKTNSQRYTWPLNPIKSNNQLECFSNLRSVVLSDTVQLCIFFVLTSELVRAQKRQLSGKAATRMCVIENGLEKREITD